MLDDEAAAAVSAEVRIPKFVADLNIFRATMHRPKLARALNLLGAVLLQGDVSTRPDSEKPALDPRLRELAIMRVGWLTKSNYEWTQHWRIARGIGVPAEDLIAVRDWRSSELLSDEDKTVLAAVDETLGGDAISDETWSALSSFLADDALVELTVVIGHWLMVSTMLRSLRVPLEEGVEAWPPDGTKP
ncbi:MAG: carboxymuconolactone decarboxylase family protein [Acidobacteria bacterium]|nr:MAG: carboxymuconolactone decarboxylase family protein [Acidobacteriota bacterium]